MNIANPAITSDIWATITQKDLSLKIDINKGVISIEYTEENRG